MFTPVLVRQSMTRRKACYACVKSKRRCDLRLPVCSTCSTRRRECRYDVTVETGPESDTNRQPSSVKAAGKHSPCLSQSIDSNELIQSGSFRISSPYDSFPFPELGTIGKDQLDNCIVYFQDCISSLVQQNQNIFIHSTSYMEILPTPYQDLLSICALYCQKNPQNRDIMFRMLDSKVTSLLAQAKTSLCSVRDRLLQMQALLLYQSIRLFDGDLRQQANAERDFEPLEAWTIELHQTYTASSNGLSWESAYQKWVLFESIRRTIMMSVALQSVYTAIRDGYCYLVPFLSGLPLSTNASLWNVREHEWPQIEAQSKCNLITYREYVDEWNHGKVLKVDAYEKMLLVACRHAIGTSPLFAKTGYTGLVYDALKR